MIRLSKWKSRPRRSTLVVPLVLSMVALLTSAVRAQSYSLLDLRPDRTSWTVGLRSTGYFSQAADTAGGVTDVTRLYQHYTGSLTGMAHGLMALHISGRFAGDAGTSAPYLDSSRFYSGYLEVKPWRTSRILVGRQFLQSGVTGLTLDGMSVGVRSGRRFEALAWGGARAPLVMDYGSDDSFSENVAAGATVTYRPGRPTRIGLSMAYRERNGGISTRPLGFQLDTRWRRSVRLGGRFAYDLETERWNRAEAQVRWAGANRQPEVYVQYVDRFPDIDAMSYFNRFQGLERIRLARTGVRYEQEKGWGGEIEFLGSFVGDLDAYRLGLAALIPWGRLGYSLRMGDVGDESTFYGELRYQVLHWLKLEAEASLAAYTLYQDAPAQEERDLTTLAFRALANLRPGFRLHMEVQNLTNPLYDNDTRLLVGIDLSMGRGTSRIGLDRGGWLR